MLRSNRLLLLIASASVVACQDAGAPISPTLRPISDRAAVVSALMTFGTGSAIGASGYLEGGFIIESEAATIEDRDGNGERELVGEASITNVVVSGGSSQIGMRVEAGTVVGILRVSNSGAVVAVAVGSAPGTLTFTHIAPGNYYFELLESPGPIAVDDISVDAMPPADATSPVITFSGATSYAVNETVAISCSATDAESGIVSQSCPGASGPAYTFALGTNTLTASATNGAGLTATASLTFTITVDAASLAALTSSFVTNPGVAGALNQKLAGAAAAPNANAKAAMLQAYVNQINAQIGKTLTAEQAAILISLAGAI